MGLMLDGIDLIQVNFLIALLLAIGPANGQFIDASIGAKAEVKVIGVLRQVTAATAQLKGLSQIGAM